MSFLKAAALALRTERYGHAGHWARVNRKLSRSESNYSGKFDPERNPYFLPVYEACESGRYSWVFVVCGSQMGKTEFQLNRIGYRLDTKPAPIMIALPNKDLAKRFSKSRVAKMMRNTPSLWEKLAKGALDNIFEKYVGGSQMKIAWATSATQFCSDPAGEVHLDEVDRMPDDIEGEGDPVSLGDARGATYPDFLLVGCSTPTIEGSSKIMKVFAKGTELVWSAPCFDCGHYFAPFFRDLRWPKGAGSGLAEREARIVCPDCGASLGDEWRKAANEPGVGKYLGPGQTVSDGQIVGELKDVKIASFRIPGLLSPWVTIGESAAKWIDACESGDGNEIKAVINTRFGELYALEGDRPEPSELDSLRAGPDSPKLPDWALLLTAGVDVQKRGLYFVVRAWGPKGRSQNVMFSWLPGDTNEDAVWSDLEEKVLNFDFETEGQKPRKLQVVKMAIDRRYREEMVDVFVAANKDKCVGALGQKQQIAPLRLNRVEVTYEGRPKLKGVQVLSLNDGRFKLTVYNRITRGPEVDDSWLISKDSTEEYCLQVLSEELVTLPNGRQKWVQKRKDNHALDCEKINLALAEWLNLRLLKEPSARNDPQKRQVTRAEI